MYTKSSLFREARAYLRRVCVCVRMRVCVCLCACVPVYLCARVHYVCGCACGRVRMPSLRDGVCRTNSQRRKPFRKMRVLLGSNAQQVELLYQYEPVFALHWFESKLDRAFMLSGVRQIAGAVRRLMLTPEDDRCCRIPPEVSLGFCCCRFCVFLFWTSCCCLPVFFCHSVCVLEACGA